ncbi:MAG: hypothetical protein HZB26_12695 [Candidatus Hydrogenedentes bacterium]|nr:hypothetical protein [Candidatus Hydrogenedentota bacterium]
MKLNFLVPVIFCACVAICLFLSGDSVSSSACAICPSGQAGDDPANGCKKSSDAGQRLASIRSEFAALQSHQWAGEYRNGNGGSFALAPETGFAFQVYGCLGLQYEIYGPVAYRNGRIRLTLEGGDLPGPTGFQLIANEFIPVSWGARKYLILPKDMIKFCNDVNSSEEPRRRTFGKHLLRYHDEYAKVDGLPNVPPEFRKYLLTSPIDARIASLGNGDLATIDVGEESGVYEGLELYLVEPSDQFITATVNAAKKGRSEVIVTRYSSNDPKPAIGWRFALRPSHANGHQ